MVDVHQAVCPGAPGRTAEPEGTAWPEIAAEAFELELRAVRRHLAPGVEVPRDGSDEELVRFLFQVVEGQPVEVFGAVYYDERRQPVGFTMPYRGTTTRVGPEKRHLLIKAWICRASSLVVFHNHPAGTMEPSPEDLSWTSDFLRLTESVGMTLRDHVILGHPPRYCSLAETGMVPGLGGRQTQRARGYSTKPVEPATQAPARTKRGKERQRAAPKPKFRDPGTGETWSGRGSRPRWLERYVADGRRVEEFAIESAVSDDAQGQKRRRASPKPKFRDPRTGRTWSGRGSMAGWLREYVEAGRSVEEFRIDEE